MRAEWREVYVAVMLSTPVSRIRRAWARLRCRHAWTYRSIRPDQPTERLRRHCATCRATEERDARDEGGWGLPWERV
jgi:hypothetical protein